MAFADKKKGWSSSRGAASPRRVVIDLGDGDSEDEDDKPKSKFKPKFGKGKGAKSETLEDVEKNVQSLGRRYREAETGLKSKREKDLAERTRRGPATSELKNDLGALKQAVRRGQIKMIAKKANPESKDSDNVFTGEDGARYARTDLYSPTISDRISSAKQRAKSSSSDWWVRNKGTIVLGSLALAAVYLFYATGKAASDRSRLAAAQRKAPQLPHRSGFERAGFLSATYDTNPFDEQNMWWSDPWSGSYEEWW